jgi:dihydrofolate reductase
MRRVVLFVDTSLDGFMGGPDGEMDWMVQDDEMDKEFTDDLRRTVDTILTGRIAYQSFESFWPAAAADPSSPADLADLANWMLDTPKVVFSTTLDKVAMKNSRLAEAGVAEEVAKLKQAPGKDLVVFGGARTVQAFVRLGLVDEYRMKVHPVAIGRGLPIFDDLQDKVGLTLVRSKAYRSGVLGLYYEPANPAR